MTAHLKSLTVGARRDAVERGLVHAAGGAPGEARDGAAVAARDASGDRVEARGVLGAGDERRHGVGVEVAGARRR